MKRRTEAGKAIERGHVAALPAQAARPTYERSQVRTSICASGQRGIPSRASGLLDRCGRRSRAISIGASWGPAWCRPTEKHALGPEDGLYALSRVAPGGDASRHRPVLACTAAGRSAGIAVDMADASTRHRVPDRNGKGLSLSTPPAACSNCNHRKLLTWPILVRLRPYWVLSSNRSGVVALQALLLSRCCPAITCRTTVRWRDPPCWHMRGSSMRAWLAG